MNSPCKMCDYIDEDKNCDRCVNCERRIKYCVETEMLPEEVLIEGTKEERIISSGKPITDKVLLVKKKKEKPNRDKPDEVKEYENEEKKSQINFYFSEELRSETEQILNDLEEIAKKELRRTTEQALYFIREGIEKWKETNK